jgi:hypothetical protein
MKRQSLLFICFFTISITLHAITLKEDTKICGVCGQPVHVTIVQKLLTGGSMELDLRPAPEKRDTLKYQMPKILDFQKKLIENKDTGRYTVADVLKEQK